MAEIEKQIEQLMSDDILACNQRRSGRAYRRQMRIRKTDRLMKIVTRHYIPHAGYIDYGFDGKTLYHSGKYIKYPQNSKAQRYLKRSSNKKVRKTILSPGKSNQYRKAFDYWWELY